VIFRAVAVWASLLILAVLNGGVRDTWRSPWLGDTFGRALSTVLLCGLIILVTWSTIGWIRPVTAREALSVGALWLALTLAFEFVVGHYGFGKAWSELLADLRSPSRAHLDRRFGSHIAGAPVDGAVRQTRARRKP
jgi:hypothetical protein